MVDDDIEEEDFAEAEGDDDEDDNLELDEIDELDELDEEFDDDDDAVAAVIPADADDDDDEEEDVVAVPEEDDDDDDEEDDGVLGFGEKALADDELLDFVDDSKEDLGLVTVPIGDGEFTCRSCFLVKRRAQMADEKKMICFDCA